MFCCWDDKDCDERGGWGVGWSGCCFWGLLAEWTWRGCSLAQEIFFGLDEVCNEVEANESSDSLKLIFNVKMTKNLCSLCTQPPFNRKLKNC